MATFRLSSELVFASRSWASGSTVGPEGARRAWTGAARAVAFPAVAGASTAQPSEQTFGPFAPGDKQRRTRTG